jgi:hypothetical protein
MLCYLYDNGTPSMLESYEKNEMHVLANAIKKTDLMKETG